MLRNNNILKMKPIYEYIKDPAEIIAINCCRLYLQLFTLSEIITGDGEAILPNILLIKSNTTKLCSYSWPIQPNPTTKQWKIRKKVIGQVFCHSSNKIRKPLGERISIPRKMWWFSPTQNSLYFRDINNNKQPQCWVPVNYKV